MRQAGVEAQLQVFEGLSDLFFHAIAATPSSKRPEGASRT